MPPEFRPLAQGGESRAGARTHLRALDVAAELILTADHKDI